MNAHLLLTMAAVTVEATTPFPNVPSYIPKGFDCTVRKAALEYAAKVLPWKKDFGDVFDALELGTRCGVVPPTPPAAAHHRPRTVPPAAHHIYVDGAKGSDTNPGTLAAPLLTIPAAVALSRQGTPRSGNDTVQINLANGPFYLNETVVLGAADSYLTFFGEEVWVSGSEVVSDLKWSKQGTSKDGATIWGAPCASKLNKGLRFEDSRPWRARHPNGNPETTGMHTSPTGWEPMAGSWLPPVTPDAPIIVKSTNPLRNDTSVFKSYQIGIGGPCNGMFVPNVSFWCNPHNPRDGEGGYWKVPSGVALNGTSFAEMDPTKWANTEDAVLHAWHLNHWATWMYQFDAFESVNGTAAATFTRGGFQDGRGQKEGKELYIENLKELLDSAGEWYLDKSAGTLYYASNSSTEAPPSRVELTNVATLFKVVGTKTLPVKQVQFVGIGFKDTSYTYMDDHAAPSCGDWALQRDAVVFFEGTEQSGLESCEFNRVDGNAAMFSKYNSHGFIKNSEFAWIGDNVMAAWGWTDELTDNGTKGHDATDGHFPIYTTIEGNLVREMGIWEKQSSAWFQAKTARTTIRNNVFFNGPRAGINFNDGLGGGNTIEENLLFNFCRESGDHGPFNSWDRQPFLTTIRDGTPSYIPAMNDITSNFFIANYNSQAAIDTDDGSAYLNSHHNIFVYASNGLKSDLGGHDNHAFSNMYLYNSPVCMFTQQKIYPDNVDAFYNNTCVLATAQHSYAAYDCSDKTAMPKMGNNTIYVPDHPTELQECGMNITDLQKTGYDVGTTVTHSLPEDSEVDTWIRTMLGM